MDCREILRILRQSFLVLSRIRRNGKNIVWKSEKQESMN